MPLFRLPLEAEGGIGKSIAGSRRRCVWKPEEADQPFQSSPYFETDSSSTSDEEEEREKEELKTDNAVESVPTDTGLNCDAEVAMKPQEVDARPEQGIRVPAVHVPIYRTEEVEKSRLKLPVVAEEQVIVEAIRECPVVIICGETGSGKTTQVPQFLYEAGMATEGKMIGITEPRRVAAISMSARVAQEMNLPSSVVSYQIRFEGNTTEETKVKFMTDGVLLKEIQKDFLLSRYSAILIDEAHERSMYSDILIGLLSRIILLRQRRGNKLHLVIMSATLRVQDFMSSKLFKESPRVIQVDSRQYPVTVYFNRHTMGNYLLAAYRKVCQVHRLLPAGTILVFVSGQQEVHTLLSWLKQTFPMNGRRGAAEAKKRRKLVNLDDYAEEPKQPDLNDADAPDLELFDIEDLDDKEMKMLTVDSDEPLFCLPLYSLMSSEKQSRVFQEPGNGCRCCVIATNAAETSITIPNVRYVVDTGKEKVRLYDPVTGISRFVVQWISKASANQRAGRAGRVAPGHCYRLYSSAVFNDLADFSKPEILTKPVDDLVLQMKAMSIVKVCNFPFPTVMDEDGLRSAEQRLVKLELLEMVTDASRDQVAKVTDLGRSVALFPVAPRYGKVLSLACQKGLLAYAVCLVSALSVREPLLNPSSIQCADKEERKARIAECLNLRRALAGHGQGLLFGDLMVLLKAVLMCQKDVQADVCERYGLRYKAMLEVQKMCRQLFKVVNALFPDISVAISSDLANPTEEQVELLRQLMLTSLCENVAQRVDNNLTQSARRAYRCSMIKELLYIHPASVLCKAQPEWVVYQEVVDSNDKKCMLNVMAIEPEWLPLFARGYCSFSEPLQQPPPFYHSTKDGIYGYVDCTYGMAAWPLPRMERLLPVDIRYYRHFAAELLEGRVVTKLAVYRPFLITPPSVLFKPWAKLQSKTDSLLAALYGGKVTTRQGLMACWRRNSKFLCQEYLQWVAQSKHGEIMLSWPPIDKE